MTNAALVVCLLPVLVRQAKHLNLNPHNKDKQGGMSGLISCTDLSAPMIQDFQIICTHPKSDSSPQK